MLLCGITGGLVCSRPGLAAIWPRKYAFGGLSKPEKYQHWVESMEKHKIEHGITEQLEDVLIHEELPGVMERIKTNHDINELKSKRLTQAFRALIVPLALELISLIVLAVKLLIH